MKLTIIIPAYNEEKTIGQVIRRVAKVSVPKVTKEIIVINDGSTDATLSIVNKLKVTRLRVISKKHNQGKGAAIRSALKVATGDIFIIQDADLEYDPMEFSLLLEPILSNKADVVYGSRLISSKPHRVLYFWHWLGNSVLTLLTNMVGNINLSDMETCYKAFTKPVAAQLTLVENRFGFEPEFTIKVARKAWRIFEVGISYSGRNYAQGKKISWTDGLWALWCIIKYGLFNYDN